MLAESLQIRMYLLFSIVDLHPFLNLNTQSPNRSIVCQLIQNADTQDHDQQSNRDYYQ